MTRRIGLLVFDGFQILDAAGPLAAFEIAARGASPPTYALELLSERGGPVRSSSGAVLLTTPIDDCGGGGGWDTLLVAGGAGVGGACQRPALRAFVRDVAARRLASVCSGAYLLAAAGRLDGRRATTHWRCAADLARRYPAIRVQPDAIFVRDDPVWTSAGITAGIDLALALIADDLGEPASRDAARELVVFHRRAGGQSQHSALLELAPRSDPIARALAFARSRLGEPLPVERLADAAGLSPRQFARRFAQETGRTPAKAVEQLRLETARIEVEARRRPLDEVARITGFGAPDRMRAAFLRAFGQPPQALRRSAARDGESLGAAR